MFQVREREELELQEARQKASIKWLVCKAYRWLEVLRYISSVNNVIVVATSHRPTSSTRTTRTTTTTTTTTIDDRGLPIGSSGLGSKDLTNEIFNEPQDRQNFPGKIIKYALHLPFD